MSQFQVGFCHLLLVVFTVYLHQMVGIKWMAERFAESPNFPKVTRIYS